MFFGNEPAVVLHPVFGETWAAHFFAFVYLLYLPISPLSLVVWLVWSRNISYGYWYATAQLPDLDAGHDQLLHDPDHGAELLVPLALPRPRRHRRHRAPGLAVARASGRPVPAEPVQRLDPERGRLRLPAHALTLVIALVTHYTVRHALIRWSAWIFFGLTVISTLYFGWHYIADDIGGVIIAVLAVWIGGIATGQKFERWGRSVRPTTSTSSVPVPESDDSDDHDRDPGKGSGRGPARDAAGQRGTGPDDDPAPRVGAGITHP